MRRRLLVVCSLTVLAATGCDIQAWLEEQAAEEIELAKEFVDRFQARDFDAVVEHFDPEQDPEALRPKFAEVAEFFPQAPPVAVETLGVSTFSSANVSRTDLSFQYEYPDDRWLLVNVRVETRDGRTVVAAMNVQPLAGSLQELHRFTLAGKGARHWAMLAAAVLVPLFVLVVLVLCIRTPMRGRKWPWVLFILLGLGKLSLNWTTGQIGFSPFNLSLLGAAVVRSSEHAPWILSVSLPLGAVVWLLKRRSLRRQPDDEGGTIPPPGEPAGPSAPPEDPAPEPVEP